MTPELRRNLQFLTREIIARIERQYPTEDARHYGHAKMAHRLLGLFKDPEQDGYGGQLVDLLGEIFPTIQAQFVREPSQEKRTAYVRSDLVHNYKNKLEDAGLTFLKPGEIFDAIVMALAPYELTFTATWGQPGITWGMPGLVWGGGPRR